MHLPHLNPIGIPTLVLAVMAYIGGLWIAERPLSLTHRWLAFAGAAVLAIPSLLLSTYYLHWLDSMQWFFEFRTLPYIEFSAAGAGVLAGMLPSLTRRRRLFFLATETATCMLLICWTAIPYLKMILAPVDLSKFSETVDKGAICLQSSDSSCGPASAATLVWRTGNFVTERELAQESFTTQSGTECWYLARALRKRGLEVRYHFLPETPDTLILHAIAGVRIGGPTGAGHFVAVLAETPDTYIIGDPCSGKAYLKKSELNSGGYYFTGFFMTVMRRDAQQ